MKNVHKKPTIVRSYHWRSAECPFMEEEIDHFGVPTGWKRFSDFSGDLKRKSFEWFGSSDFRQACLNRFRTRHLTIEEMIKDVMGRVILWKENGAFMPYLVDEYCFDTFFASGIESEGCVCFSDRLLVNLYYGELECVKLCVY